MTITSHGATPCLPVARIPARPPGLRIPCDTIGVLGPDRQSDRLAGSCRPLETPFRTRRGSSWALLSCDLWTGPLQSPCGGRASGMPRLRPRDFTYLQGETPPRITHVGRDSVARSTNVPAPHLDVLGIRCDRLVTPAAERFSAALPNCGPFGNDIFALTTRHRRDPGIPPWRGSLLPRYK